MKCNDSRLVHTTFKHSSFCESVNILCTKPHVINKRVWGSKIWFRHTFTPNLSTWESPLSIALLKDMVTEENIEQQKNVLLNEFYSTDITSAQTDKLASNIENEDSVEIILMELLPKAYTSNKAYQLVCFDRSKLIVKFYNITPERYEEQLCPGFSYSLQLQNNNITLSAECDELCKSFLWLKETLLPQFIKWGTEAATNLAKCNTICNESLTLVCKNDYYEKYNYLKLKYGKETVKIWPECTDPSKFVYEDIAIATYLLLLWEAENPFQKKFVDLGCGNGLLVYILTEEGHIGVGIDVRKRQIWDMYPKHIQLQEKTIIPSDISLFPETDWILGNHSDELTPWIPVIATKSSYKCNFFLLPCCAYNFDGSKYQRRNSFKSQYIDYLEYINQLCEECGFNVATDRLKIPSTKRICLVGRGRNYPQCKYSQYCDKIQELIQAGTNKCTPDNEFWVKDFKARNPIERVRNCTQLDHNLKESIISCISKYLMEGCNIDGSNWSIGRTVEFNELVQLVPQDKLKQLKSECGGIQTLLKNYHNIFKVQNGKVQLRYPTTIEEVRKNSKKRQNSSDIKIQQKPCWFYNNHPQGCPLNDTDCSFIHTTKL